MKCVLTVVTSAIENNVIPGVTAVFLAGMNRNPGIHCGQYGFPRSRE